MVKPTPTPLPGDPSIVAGGIELPPQLIATPPTSDMPVPSDELGQLVYSLVHLHPEAVPSEFQGMDVGSLDQATQLRLIGEIQRTLGVKPLRDEAI